MKQSVKLVSPVGGHFLVSKSGGKSIYWPKAGYGLIFIIINLMSWGWWGGGGWFSKLLNFLLFCQVEYPP